MPISILILIYNIHARMLKIIQRTPIAWQIGRCTKAHHQKKGILYMQHVKITQ